MVELRRIDPDEYGGETKRLVARGLRETYADDVRALDEDGVLVVAEDDGRVVGFASGYDTETPEDYVEGLDEEVGARSVFEKVVVDQEYRGRGLGTRLVAATARVLDDPVLTESWVRSEAPDSTGVMERVGFEETVRFENRWYEESKRAGDEEFCPDCGEICECDSVVYVLTDGVDVDPGVRFDGE